MSRDQIIGNRLKQEREALNLTLKYATECLGFNHYQTLSSIESGERAVKAWELMRLSQLYHRDIRFFLDIDRQKQQEQRVLWREASRTSNTVLAERKFLSLCQNFRRLTELAGERGAEDTILLPVDGARLRSEQFWYASKLADECRRYLDLGGRPACALSGTLENRLNILVLHLDLQDGGSAAATCGPTGRAVLINSRDVLWRRNYDIAHEFFHVLTWHIFTDSEIHSERNRGKKSTVEQLADAFASALLLPGDEVKENS